MTKNKSHFELMLILLYLFLLPALVMGQEDKKPSKSQEPATGQQIETPEMDEQTIKIFLDKIEVEGKLEKPQAVFIIPGTNPMIDDFQIERSFFNEIFRPVEKKSHAIVRPAAKPTTDRKDVIPW